MPKKTKKQSINQKQPFVLTNHQAPPQRQTHTLGGAGALEQTHKPLTAEESIVDQQLLDMLRKMDPAFYRRCRHDVISWE